MLLSTLFSSVTSCLGAGLERRYGERVVGVGYPTFQPFFRDTSRIFLLSLSPQFRVVPGPWYEHRAAKRFQRHDFSRKLTPPSPVVCVCFLDGITYRVPTPAPSTVRYFQAFAADTPAFWVI